MGLKTVRFGVQQRLLGFGALRFEAQQRLLRVGTLWLKVQRLPLRSKALWFEAQQQLRGVCALWFGAQRRPLFSRGERVTRQTPGIAPARFGAKLGIRPIGEPEKRGRAKKHGGDGVNAEEASENAAGR